MDFDTDAIPENLAHIFSTIPYDHITNPVSCSDSDEEDTFIDISDPVPIEKKPVPIKTKPPVKKKKVQAPVPNINEEDQQIVEQLSEVKQIVEAKLHFLCILSIVKSYTQIYHNEAFIEAETKSRADRHYSNFEPPVKRSRKGL